MMRPWCWGSTVRYGAFIVLRNIVMLVFLTVPAVSFAQTRTIVAFGDSLTQGFGLPIEQGFVPQLERWLQDQGQDVIVTNAGVSGDTTQGGVSRIDWTLAGPVDLLIVNLGGNDMLRGLPVELTRANLKKIIQSAKSKDIPVVLVGMQAALNFGPDYKTAFDGIYKELSVDPSVALYANFFAPLIPPGQQVPDIGAYFQQDAIHPNADGVAKIISDFGPFLLRVLD